MTDSNSERIDVFLLKLKDALETSDPQTEDILAEVRGDLEAHVERHLEEGGTEDEAVARAIDEMGNPFELAHHMRREVPPFGGTALRTIRYIAAGGLILWTVILLWMMRGGVYGFSPLLVGIVVFLHFPGILLLWPRIVWSRNWLFGLIPAGLVVAVAMIAAFAGVQSSSEVTIPFPVEGEAPVVLAPVEDPADSGPPLAGVMVAAALTVFSIVLLLAVQRRTQRRLAVIALLVGVGVVEAVYQGEEMIFRRDRERIRAYLDGSFDENGTYPTKEEFDAKGPKPRTSHVSLRTNGDSFTFFWVRPLSKGHSLIYSSEGDRVRVQD